MNLGKTQILVTGGAGYIGSHTCKALALAGFTPIVFDDLSHGYEHNVKWGPLIKGDIRDEKAVADVFSKYKIDAVVHFAGLISVGESVLKPDLYFDVNFTGSKLLTEAMERAGVHKIIFSSTAAVYKPGLNHPIPESHALEPLNPYGESKLKTEELLRSKSKIKSVSLRYFNACGADSECELGEEHEPETHLIPLCIQSLKDGNTEFKIFGNDYPTPDGTCVRDYIHVSDLADAHVLALKKLLAGEPLKPVYNLGTGKGYSVTQITQTLADLLGKKVKFEIAPRRAGDSPILVADSSLAQKELGWNPSYREIPAILKTAIDFTTSCTD